MKKFYKLSMVGLVSGSYAQQRTLNLSYDNLPIQQVINDLKTKTGFEFVYQTETLGNARITLNMQNASLPNALERVLTPNGLQYQITGNTVVIRRASQPAATGRTITGTVTTAEGEPLVGATVSVKGTQRGTVTGADGRFTIQINTANPVLSVSYIGMVTQEIPATGNGPYLIVLLESSEAVGEVIVTGYQTIKRESATGAYQVISEADWENRYSSDIISNLEGRIPGMISYNKGLTNDEESNIMIRGVSTFAASTKPLVVVDGLPIEGSIETVNPYDISSITVLKDAAAASIYGARASNGVIVIVTKRAKSDRIEVSASADFSISDKQSYGNYGYVNAAQQIMLEELNAAATMADPTYSQYLDMYASMYPSYVNPVLDLYLQRHKGLISGDQYDYITGKLKQNDYLSHFRKYALENRALQQYNLSLRTRTDRLSTNITFNFKRSNEGVAKEHNNTFGLNYRGDLKVAKWMDLSFGTNIIVGRSKKHSDQLGYLLNPWSVPSYTNIFNEDGSKNYYYMAVPFNTPAYAADADRKLFKDESYNLLDELNRNFTTVKSSNLRAVVNATFNIAEGLTASTQFQYEDIVLNSEKYLEKESYDMRHIYNLFTSNGVHYCPDGGILDNSKNKGDHYTMRVQANFLRTFAGVHDVSAIAGVELRETNTRTVNNRILGYIDGTQTNSMNTTNLAAARNLASSDLGATYTNPYMTYNLASGFTTSDVKHRYSSLYFTGNYTYDRRYAASVSFRVDKSDLFGADPKLRGRPLWSVGGSWNAHNEEFLGAADWINMLKLRLTYGLTGNINPNISSLLTARIYNTTLYPGTQAAALNNPPNDQLRWEKTASWNLGLDFAFLKNRFTSSVDFYHKYSTDLLSSMSLDPSVGYTSLVINNGEALNQGIEFQLNAEIVRPARPDGLRVSLMFNIAHNKNEIRKVTINQSSGIGLLGWGSSSVSLVQGNPVNSIYAFRFAGFEDDHAQIPWYNATGDKMTTGIYSNLKPADVVFAGGLDPKLTMSISPEVSFERFTMTAMLAYYGGHYMRANANNWTNGGTFMGYGYTGAIPATYLDYWTGENNIYPANGTPGVSRTLESQGIPFLDQCVFPADFFKIRSIVLSYSLPANISKKIGAGSVRVRFQMNNVATWVKNNLDIDPEANNAWTGSKSLVTLKSYVMGININF